MGQGDSTAVEAKKNVTRNNSQWRKRRRRGGGGKETSHRLHNPQKLYNPSPESSKTHRPGHEFWLCGLITPICLFELSNPHQVIVVFTVYTVHCSKSVQIRPSKMVDCDSQEELTRQAADLLLNFSPQKKKKTVSSYPGADQFPAKASYPGGGQVGWRR